jgi:phosphoglycerate dehydrogenase-like enzyme
MLPTLDRFRPILEGHGVEVVTVDVRERLSEEELLPIVGDLDGAICGDDRFTRRVLEAAPRLKVISKWGTGVDSIDRAAAAARGVVVCNTPGAFSDPVADTTLGYILCFARGLVDMTAAMRAGRWSKAPGIALNEATVGIVGVGCAGRAVARRARAFGTTILGTDPVRPPEAFIAETGIELTDLETLLARADFVTLHCDLNPTSVHIMNAAAFARMRPDTVLINTARGPLVDEPALIEALRSRRLGGAALDVFEVEPLPIDSPLLAMPNVLLAAHNANASPAAWERVHWSTLANLFRVLAGSVPAAVAERRA